MLTQLGIGEAVVTVLSERGAPTPVAWTRLQAPQSLMGPTDAAVVAAMVAASPLEATYGQAVDRESAYEMLTARLAPARPRPAAPAPAAPAPQLRRRLTGRAAKPEPSMVEEVLKSSAAKSFMRSAGSALGREITRGIFGTAKRKR